MVCITVPWAGEALICESVELAAVTLELRGKSMVKLLPKFFTLAVKAQVWLTSHLAEVMVKDSAFKS